MLQKSSSIGLGAYSGSNESLFGAKGPASFLGEATFIFGSSIYYKYFSYGIYIL